MFVVLDILFTAYDFSGLLCETHNKTVYRTVYNYINKGLSMSFRMYLEILEMFWTFHQLNWIHLELHTKNECRKNLINALWEINMNYWCFVCFYGCIHSRIIYKFGWFTRRVYDTSAQEIIALLRIRAHNLFSIYRL